MEQRLHSALAPIDLLTRLEMEETLHKGLNEAIREKVRGLDIARLPATFGAGNAGTLNLISSGDSDPYMGPESGDIWMLRRVCVVSSAFTSDPARYILFKGSTPSDVSNAYSNRTLLESGFAGVSNTTLTAPAVPASTVAAQNTSSQPYTVVVTGGTVTAVTVNGVTVGGGDGTYVVPAYGAIAVTYSVAPTWTWTATASFTPGFPVGIGYYPGNKAVFLQPGEQVYAQVYNTTVGNTYTINGEAIRCPAEMKGKVL
jgi:hypothetical protein